MATPLPDHMPIVAERVAREGTPGTYLEREIVSAVDLCDGRGNLNPEAIGWSRQPPVRANLSGHPLRKKRWNFWNWIEPDFVFSVTMAELDYASLFGTFFIDFETGEESRGTWLGLPGRFDMPEHEPRSISYRSRAIEYRNDLDGATRSVRFRATPQLGGEIAADLSIGFPEGQESLNVVVPWSDQRFQLNSKHNTLPTSGRIRVGERSYELDPERCHAVQDWGRGIWPRRSFWNWGVCTGVQDGRRIGVNFGAKWTGGTGANENGILLDGRLHKVMEDLHWEYDPADDAGSWRVHSEHSDAIDLVLSPRFPHRSRTNIGIVSSGGICSFGTWSGRVRAGGETIEISSLPGWAEEFSHRW
ncbi:MAG: DUF2804 domain-containing protein [bacterium]|nr:DUF2804 domain-containing protein [bacterium]